MLQITKVSLFHSENVANNEGFKVKTADNEGLIVKILQIMKVS